MRRNVVVVVLMTGFLLTLGCAGAQKVDKNTKIQCPKCGVEFSVQEGMEAHGK